MPKNILIIGVDGLIGSSLFSILEITEHKIFGTSKSLGSKFPCLDITAVIEYFDIL